MLFLLSPDVARANMMKLPSSPPGVHNSGSCCADKPIQRKDEDHNISVHRLCLDNTVKYLFNEKGNNEISIATIFTWAYQFTIYSYVQMFHCNEYHFKKISLPSNKKPTRSEKQYKQYKDSFIPWIKKPILHLQRKARVPAKQHIPLCYRGKCHLERFHDLNV